MAKRGRPVDDLETVKKKLKEAYALNDILRAQIKNMAAEAVERKGQITGFEFRIEQLNMIIDSNKELAARTDELLEEIRMHEQMIDTLRAIIIDAMRGRD